MFTEIIKIKNIGIFKDFNPNPCIKLNKNNIFYALNGHGKSTLTAIINSIIYCDNDLIHGRKTLGEVGDLECILKKGISGDVYQIDNKKWVVNGNELDVINNEVIVFDDNYISNNIFAERFEVDHKKNLHKIIFGERGITLNTQLNQLKKEKDEERKRLDGLVNTFSIPPQKIEEYIKIDISKLDKDELEKEKIDIDKKIKNIQEQTKIKSKDNFKKLPKFSYVLENMNDDFINLKINGVAHQTAKVKVEEYKNEYFNNQTNSENYLKYGLENIKGNICSFCHQDLTPKLDLIEIYKNFFDEEYEKILLKLNEYYNLYKTYNFELDINNLIQVYTSNKKSHEEWKEIIGEIEEFKVISDIKEYIAVIKSNYQSILLEMENKLKDLNSDFVNGDLLKLISAINSSNELIDEYNLVIDKINNFIIDFKSSLNSSQLPVLQASSSQIELKLKRFNPLEIKKVELFNSIKERIENKDILIEDKRTELNTYTETIIRDYETLINQKLIDLGITSFEIGHIEDKTHVNGSYVEVVIKINEQEIHLKDYDDSKPSFKNTLSKGDKNSLAFAFYLAFIEKMDNKENLILVFDDPLSSHDENRQDSTALEIKKLTGIVKQTIILTHKKDFFKTLNEKFRNRLDLTYFEIKKSGKNSDIKVINPNEFLKNQIQKIITNFNSLLNGEPTELRSDHLLGDIRKLFEGVLRIKYYNRTKDHTAIMQYDNLTSIFFNNDLLVDIKDDLLDLAQISNSGSHVGYDSLNEEQMKGKVRKALELIEKV